MNYTPYHIHTDYSLLDSCTQYIDYIDKAVELGMKAIAFSEHGKISGWFKKMQYCKKNGIKYIHAVECYLTESLTNKIRDNYHTILIARNINGLKEINKIIAKSFDNEHFYYVNRISFDEFLNLSDNVITTSACLAGPLNKLDKSNSYYEKLIRRYDYLEIQPHKDRNQITYNIDLTCMSEQYDKPLIAGTDSHSVNAYKAECRKILMKYKGQSYGDEDNFDLVFKSYDELVKAFEEQNAIPRTFYMQAIDNTNAMANSIEEYDIDTSIKYPLLYGSKEADHEKFIECLNRKFQEKIDKGIIPSQQIESFKKAIDEEVAVFTKIGMDGFMLSMSEILSWCRENGIVIGPARGSVGGSRVAYILDIIDLNAETWHTVFSRFANEDRVEVGDIDTDVIEEDRPKIFKYVTDRFGISKCARVSAFGTIADKAAIDEIGGALAKYWEEENPNQKDNPYSLAKIKEIKKEYSLNPEITKQKYPKIFYYYDGMVGTKVSQSIHPAGMVISPITLTDNYGTFDKDGDNCLFFDMDECHDAGLVKYDFLCLVNVKVIKDTCEMIGIDYPKTCDINWEDEAVWKDMLKSPAGIFQMESDFAFQMLSKFKPQNIFDMSLVTACIRPSGASYRNELMSRTVHDNKSELINELLKDNYGQLVYQEDVIKFLKDVCGFTGSEADTMRRAIAKKKIELIEPQLPKVIEGYCSKSNKPREIAEAEARNFVKIMEDASSYMFGYNHSIAYCLIGYLCAYFRYYHPVEFITSLLNNSDTEEDINKFTELAHVYGITIISPKYGLSKGHYFPDVKNKSISQGISSIKYLSDDVADTLYDIANSYDAPQDFVSLLFKIKNTKNKITSKHLDILIKINFFSKFGNVRELSQIYKMFEIFDFGKKTTISKDKFNNEQIINIIGSYTNFGLDKKGNPSKNYIFSSNESVLNCAIEIEKFIKSLNLKELPVKVQINNLIENLGYVPATGNTEDKMTLIISSVSPIMNKNGNIWQYRINATSLGSGKSARLSVSKEMFTNYPLSNGSIIKANDIKKDEKGYWHLINYNIL